MIPFKNGVLFIPPEFAFAERNELKHYPLFI